MNDLNSSLIQGSLIGDPQKTVDGVVFTVCSKYINKNTKETITTKVFIKAKGKLAEKCLERLTIGDHIRCIGRLENIADTNNVVLIAEHIEFNFTKVTNEKTIF